MSFVRPLAIIKYAHKPRKNKWIKLNWDMWMRKEKRIHNIKPKLLNEAIYNKNPN